MISLIISDTKCRQKCRHFVSTEEGFIPPLLPRNLSHKEGAGFTLAEVMVCVAIAVVVFSGMYMVLHIGNTSWFMDMGMLDLQQGARLAMDGITRELRQAVLSNVTITDGGKRVDFSIPNVDDTVAYYLDNNQIIREHPSATEKVIGNDVSSLNFSISGDIVAVQVGLAKTVLNRDLSFSLSEKVRVRNE